MFPNLFLDVPVVPMMPVRTGAGNLPSFKISRFPR
jgi:hypothetical protein